ncbi:hypothetical protein [Haloplasma contractile]|uniref:Uncharacterized protein n=1 Tax=Haloplasma contractile SSD-17B TaxID=1033810 RepID=U2EFX6_9MOLU|nr:hypothetical protein [Haloplasma contractile]ERJ13516.1 hypothetical protein HLPCO_000167 [Haloplasma contractile SSD-17B]
MKRYLIKVSWIFVGSIVLFSFVCSSNAKIELIFEQIKQTTYIPVQKVFNEDTRTKNKNCSISLDTHFEDEIEAKVVSTIEYRKSIALIADISVDEPNSTQPGGDEKLPDPV